MFNHLNTLNSNRFSSENIQGAEKDVPKTSSLLLEVLSEYVTFETLKISVPKDHSLMFFTRNVIAASPGS